MNINNIVFWRISPSPHLDSLFPALRNINNEIKIYTIFLDRLSTRRKQQGWNEDIVDSEYDIYFPTENQIRSLIKKFDNNTVHVFSGITYHKTMRYIFRELTKHPVKRVIITEGIDFSGIIGKLKYLRIYWHEQRFFKFVDMVFTIGSLAEEMYCQLGLAKNKIRPFCYVIDSDNSPPQIDTPSKNFQFGVIGRLIPIKRVDLIITALSKIQEQNWELTVIGDGPERSNLELLSSNLNLSNQIKFTGVIPNVDARNYMKTLDCMIFPSNADGWGAVVNESLLVGTPVICSDYPGAADLIHINFNGYIFQTDSESSLIEQIKIAIAGGKLGADKRQKIINWSTSILPNTVANYFYEQIKKDEPSPPPWRITVTDE